MQFFFYLGVLHLRPGPEDKTVSIKLFSQRCDGLKEDERGMEHTQHHRDAMQSCSRGGKPL